jgi:hypothetical protein
MKTDPVLPKNSTIVQKMAFGWIARSSEAREGGQAETAQLFVHFGLDAKEVTR